MKIVALGGGHGLAMTLRAARELTDDVVAVVSMADDGGSSGRLRQEFGVLPPGDVRMALLALADEHCEPQAQLWGHRFAGDGELSGHNLGNLLLTALWQIAGAPIASLLSTAETLSTAGSLKTSVPRVSSGPGTTADPIVLGIDAAAHLLGISGRVLPVSTCHYALTATASDDTGEVFEITGQADITASDLTIHRVTTNPPDITACEAVLDEIASADLVILGPGSWFTSVLAATAVPGIARAIAESAATVVVVANLRPQMGESQRFQPEDYLLSIRTAHESIRVNVVIVPPNFATAEFLSIATAMEATVVATVLADDTQSGHNPVLLARALQSAIAVRENSCEQGAHGNHDS